MDDVQLESAFQEAITSAAAALTAELLRTAPDMLAEQRIFQSEFEERLFQHWGKALDLFQTILVVARDAGDSINQQQRQRADEEQDFTFDVLSRLHARACLTASEVGVLLRSGYADAAMARWRTLHEITVVAGFLKRYDRQAAERYLLHEIVESLKAAEEYQHHYERLGDEPLDPEDLRWLRAQRDSLCERFGRAFGDVYGWAAAEFNGLSPSFKALEEAAGLDHLRPYYRMASHGVHSNPKGIKFSLGLSKPQRFLLTGPSNAGLCDPGHATLISLTNCTINLLTHAIALDTLVTSQALLQLTETAGQTFLDAHIEMKIRERESSHTDESRFP